MIGFVLGGVVGGILLIRLIITLTLGGCKCTEKKQAQQYARVPSGSITVEMARVDGEEEEGGAPVSNVDAHRGTTADSSTDGHPAEAGEQLMLREPGGS